MDAAAWFLPLQLSEVALVNRLIDITGWGLVIFLATIVVTEMVRPPIVYVGKIEQTFVPIEYPPAIWR